MFDVLWSYIYVTMAVFNELVSGKSLGEAVMVLTSRDSLTYEIQHWVLSIICTLMFAVFSYKYVAKQSDKELDYSMRVALMGIVVGFVAQSSVDGMKTWWGRPRPIDVFDNGQAFTKWFQINGHTGFTSFPSGHTRLSWLYLYLPFFVKRNQIMVQKILFWLTLAIGILSAYARIVIGVHWLTDITMSTLIVVSTIFLASRILQAHFYEKDA